MSLEVRDALVKRGAFALAADFETPSEGITVVFGPSGAGKSMLLSTVVGLNRLSRGLIRFNGRVLEDVAAGTRAPTHVRGIGLVFQDARLFPHLSVRGNLEYAQSRRPADRNAPIVAEIAKRMELEALLDRPVKNLSGGEKSRVALARAMVSAPELLLLDEPFAALDGKRRRAYLTLLRDLARIEKLPMMVVTHQIDDAVELADHVLAVKDGRVVASGTAAAVMRKEAFVSLLDRRDLGARVDASSVVAGRDAGGVWVRADNVLIATEPPRGLSARNVWEGRIASIVREPDGGILVAIATSQGYISSRITEQAVSELALSEGAKAWAVVKTHSL